MASASLILPYASNWVTLTLEFPRTMKAATESGSGKTVQAVVYT